MKALVVGGAGATGRLIVAGLLARDYEVTVLSRGYHAPPSPERVTTLVSDPFELAALQSDLEGHQYDLAVVTYGVLRHVAEVLVGKVPRVISVGGAAPIFKGWGEMTSINPWETTQSTPLRLPEDHPLSRAEGLDRFAGAVRKAEQTMLAAHAAGDYSVTHFRYPLVYGPQNICPAEWGIVRRVRDKRRQLIVPGGGLTIVARGYADNMAHAILLAVDNPEASGGQIYNLCDERLQYNTEWVDRLSSILGHEFDCVDIPFSWLPPGFRATPPQLLYRHHCALDIDKIRTQLGYRDQVSFEEALERTVAWYMDNPLPPGHETEQNLGDPFDYAYEDAIIEAYRSRASTFAVETEGLPKQQVVWRHPYLKPADARS
jgi:nucleoside-diphosphate-sugar epimerase